MSPRTWPCHQCREVAVRPHHTQFLGHRITAHGVSPLPNKVEAICQFKQPVTVKGLQEFVGMVNFYRRFIPATAKIMQPLFTALTGKPKTLQWSDASILARVHKFTARVHQQWHTATTVNNQVHTHVSLPDSLLISRRLTRFQNTVSLWHDSARSMHTRNMHFNFLVCLIRTGLSH